MSAGATKRWRDDAGLTILELMIVLAILSLIGATISVQVVGQMDRAKADVARLQLRQVQGALALFAMDMHRNPTAEEGLAVLVDAPEQAEGWRGPYLRGEAALLDPWGQSLLYRLDAAGGYTLASLGGDRKGASDDIVLDGMQ